MKSTAKRKLFSRSARTFQLQTPDIGKKRGRAKGTLFFFFFFLTQKSRNMKGAADEWRRELTGLAAHGDTQLHAWQRRAFIRGQS